MTLSSIVTIWRSTSLPVVYFQLNQQASGDGFAKSKFHNFFSEDSKIGSMDTQNTCNTLNHGFEMPLNKHVVGLAS